MLIYWVRLKYNMDHFILQSRVAGSTPRTGRVPSNIVVQQAKEFRIRAAVSSVEAVIEVCYVALFQMNYYTVHGGMVTERKQYLTSKQEHTKRHM